jgi:hypothetical protein
VEANESGGKFLPIATEGPFRSLKGANIELKWLFM